MESDYPNGLPVVGTSANPLLSDVLNSEVVGAYNKSLNLLDSNPQPYAWTFNAFVSELFGFLSIKTTEHLNMFRYLTCI